MNKYLILCTILLFLSLSAPLTQVAHSQDSQPDQILIEPQTPVNIMQLRLEGVGTSGIEGRLYVENSNLTLYLEYNIVAPEGTITPATPATRIWNVLGLIPPKGLDLIPSDPMLQYDITFTSPGQSILITSYSLSKKSLVFDALVVAFNWVPLLSVYGPEEIADSLSRVADFGSRMLTLGESLDCFDPSPNPIDFIMDVDNCVISMSKLLNSTVFRELVSSVAFQMGVDISADAIGEVITTLNHLDALSNIADGVANTFILAIGGTVNNQYIVRPGSIDPTLLTPWPPRSLYPSGFAPNRLPRFEWQGILNSGDYYELQLDNDSDYSSPIIHVTTTRPFLDAPLLLESSTTYYWRVRAHNSRAKEPSAWSTDSFVTGMSAAGDSSVPDSSATETAIAAAVNNLFAQTAVAATATTEYVIKNPTAVPTLDPRQDPVYVVRVWTAAVARLDTETVLQHTCQSNQEEVRDQMMFAGALLGLGNMFSQATGQGTLTIDLSGVTFNLVEQSPGFARIHIEGEIVTKVGSYYDKSAVNQTVPMILEGNAWKVCE